MACSLDGWDSFSGAVVVGSPYGAMAPDVNGISRFEELCAMRANGLGSVVSNSPSHSRVRARFYAFPHLSIARGSNEIPVFAAYSADDGGGTELFRISWNAGNWVVNATANGGGTNSATAGPAGWDWVEVDWNPGSSTIDVWINEDSTSVGPSFTVASGSNATTMESVKLGLLEGLGNYSGELYVDSVELRNETAIGEVLNCDAMPDGTIDFNDLLAQYNEIFGGTLSTGTPDCDFNGGPLTGGVVDFNDLLAAYNIIFPPPP